MSDLQAQTDLNFVRRQIVDAEPPPRPTRGAGSWLQRNLFASVGDTIMTVVALLLIAWALPPLIDWAFLSAAWDGQDRSVCTPTDVGACWAFVKAKFAQFIYGRYPLGERWRVDVVFLLGAAGLIPFAIPSVPHKAWNAGYLFLVFPIAALILLTGGNVGFGLGTYVLIALAGCFAAALSAIVAVGMRTPVTAFVISAALLVSLASLLLLLFGGALSSVVLTSVLASMLVGGAVVAAVGAVAAVALAPGHPGKGRLLAIAIVTLTVLLIAALLGFDFGLPPVETALWGGLLVTLVVSYVGIAASLPLGILLALGRRSLLPVVRTLCIAFIEFWRGVPLITVLFMASVMLPLFTPPGVNFDKLLRALIGVALFSSAYMAENIRGGLQAIPKGQYEAAQALGLGYWKMMRLVVLPQALKLVIPGIVNTFISLLKDTSLVYIIGLFDLLGIVRLNFTDTNWSSWQTPATGLVFAAFVFWLMCFSISRYSQFLERRLNTGHKR